VRDGRGGAREGRSVHRLPRQRGRRELRKKQAAGVGDDLRSLDAGGAGFLSSRKGIVEQSRAALLVRRYFEYWSVVFSARGQRQRPLAPTQEHVNGEESR